MTFSKRPINEAAPSSESARASLQASLREALAADVRVWVLVAEPGMGKTTFLRGIMREFAASPFVSVRHPLGTDTPSGFWSALLSQIDLEGSRSPGSPHEAARWAADHLPLAEGNRRLVFVDSIERAVGLLDASGFAGLDELASGVTVAIGARPGPHLDLLASGGAKLVWLDSQSVGNINDIRAWVSERLEGFPPEAVEAVVESSEGNFLVAHHLAEALCSGELAPHDLAETPAALEAALAAMWSELLDTVPVDMHDDVVRVACVLSEAGEPLPAVSIADFLGFSASRVRRVLVYLRPLLHTDKVGHRFFSSRMSGLVASRFRRDLVQVHEQIVSFFRDAYPSWEEMDDRYGWFYLGHHCDRLARTARRRDYSTLHWLGEGPYIKAKLAHTQSLSAVLQDLCRCLRAALEERNLPRIVGYGLRIPRLRAQEAVHGLHDLADLGKFELATERALLLKSESARLKALLLLAWQAAQEERLDTASEILIRARDVVNPDFLDEERLLYAYIMTDLLAVLPQNEVFGVLFNCRSRSRNISVAWRISLMDKLPREIRMEALKLGLHVARQIPDRDERNACQAKLTSEYAALKAMRRGENCESTKALISEVNVVKCDFENHEGLKAALEALEQAQEDPEAAFHQALEIASGFAWEPRKVQGFAALAQVLTQRADEEWTVKAFDELISVIVSLRSPEERQSAVISITRIITGRPREIGWRGVHMRLGAVIETVEDRVLRVTAWVWLALALHESRDFKGAHDTLNKCASLAFHIDSSEEQVRSLALLSSCAVAIGNPNRARELAFHGLQVAEAPAANKVDVETRAAMVVGVSANVSEERSLEYFDFSIKAAREMPDMRVRASLLSALANGLAELGERDRANAVQDQAVGVARAMDPGAAQAKVLGTLAVQEALWGNVPKADQLLKEAEAAARNEPQQSLRRDALLATAACLRSCGNETNSRSIVIEVYGELEKLTTGQLAQASELAQLAQLVGGNDSRMAKVSALLKRAGKGLRSGNAPTRDEGLLLLAQAWLSLNDLEQAKAEFAAVEGIEERMRGRVLLAKALIRTSPEESLNLLTHIPIFEERMRGVRECTVELLRSGPMSRRKEVLDTLAELTLLAIDDEVTADILVGRWVNLETNRKSVIDALGKLGYSAEAMKSGRVADTQSVE